MQGLAKNHHSFRIAPFCALACAILGALFLGLGGLRLFSISLENRLNMLAIRLEEVRESRAGLQARVALQAAPVRVYDKARLALGMCPPKNMALVLVPDNLKPVAEREEAGENAGENALADAGLLESLFVSQASARE